MICIEMYMMAPFEWYISFSFYPLAVGNNNKIWLISFIRNKTGSWSFNYERGYIDIIPYYD